MRRLLERILGRVWPIQHTGELSRLDLLDRPVSTGNTTLNHRSNA